MNSFLKRLVYFCLILLAAAGWAFFAFNTDVQSAGTTYGDSDVPVILPRSTWDNSPALNALMTWWPQPAQSDGTPSDWQPVERIIVHDTGCDASSPTCNNNTDPIATIQAIYRYHAVTRGWGDIGYNYIIDQQGRIYEGRYGGNGSRGAHVYVDRTDDNFNYGSIGITILGNYANVQPSAAVYASLERLVGWLSAVNGLNPQGQSSSYVWNRQKGGFQTFFSGSVVLGHKDIEPGNPDPALVDFVQVRAAAATFAVKYKDYIYQKGGTPEVYKIVSGARQDFNTLADFTAPGNTYSRLASLSDTQLGLFSASRFLKYPDGTLAQIKNDPKIYLIADGKKRSFDVSAKQFTRLGYDFGKVRQVTADELNNYPAGLSVKYGPDGQLVSDGDKVYLIENGKKRWVTSGQLFSLLGYQWSKVKKADAAAAATYLSGAVMFYPEGTLIRAQNQAEIYLVKDGQKHQFLSAQSFLKLGYQWSKVKVVDSTEVALCPSGSIMVYPTGTLVQAAGGSANVFLVDKGMLRSFLSEEIFSLLGYKHAQILTVSADELAFYPIGALIGYKDGTLVRPNDRNDVYLISGGQPQPIDGVTFKKRKYSWASVKVVSAQDFGVLYEGKTIPSVNPASSSSPTPSPSPTSSVSPTPSATPTPSASPSPVSSAMPKIRVAIYEVTASPVTLTADGSYDVLNKAGQVIAAKNANENYTYSFSSPADAYVKIVPRAASGIVQIVSYEDHPSWKPTLNYNQFRGAIEIVYSAKSQKVWAVNELPLEDYLKGVAETNQGLNMEYLKTMSVAARTYAYHYEQLGGKYGTNEVYDITNTTSDQLYKGYSREAYASDVVTVQTVTYGEIVSYNGQAIVTAYSSGAPELMATGSRSACSVWGGKYCQAGYEYLTGGVKDPAGTTYGYTVCGGGNHCVGLSGAGTRQLAAQGKTYKDILLYYYPGTTIQKIY